MSTALLEVGPQSTTLQVSTIYSLQLPNFLLCTSKLAWSNMNLTLEIFVTSKLAWSNMNLTLEIFVLFSND